MVLHDAHESEDVIRRGRLVGSITPTTDSPSALKDVDKFSEREKNKHVVIFPSRPLEAPHTLWDTLHGTFDEL